MESAEHDKKHHEHHEHREHHPHTEHIGVHVAYVGHPEYHAEFLPSATVGEVKLRAMKHFGLEASAADKYALQHGGADIKNDVKLETFHAKKVSFCLEAVEATVKG